MRWEYLLAGTVSAGWPTAAVACAKQLPGFSYETEIAYLETKSNILNNIFLMRKIR